MGSYWLFDLFVLQMFGVGLTGFFDLVKMVFSLEIQMPHLILPILYSIDGFYNCDVIVVQW